MVELVGRYSSLLESVALAIPLELVVMVAL
jgi:hypothetical protein